MTASRPLPGEYQYRSIGISRRMEPWPAEEVQRELAGELHPQTVGRVDLSDV